MSELLEVGAKVAGKAVEGALKNRDIIDAAKLSLLSLCQAVMQYLSMGPATGVATVKRQVLERRELQLRKLSAEVRRAEAKAGLIEEKAAGLRDSRRAVIRRAVSEANDGGPRRLLERADVAPHRGSRTLQSRAAAISSADSEFLAALAEVRAAGGNVRMLSVRVAEPDEASDT